MVDNMLSREQRIRQEAQLNSLYTSLASYRKQEASYIESGAAIPEALSQQINEARHNIAQIEQGLFGSSAQSPESQAREFYRQAFELELNGDLNKAIKLYKKAGRYGHADVTTAIRSVQYRIKRSKRKAAESRMPIPASQTRNRSVFGLAVLAIILLMIVAFVLSGRVPSGSQAAAVEAPTATPSPTVELIVPPTATPLPADTATSTPLPPTNAPQPTATDILPTDTPTPQPSPTATLRPAPRIIEPKNGLVWGDGAVVFEFVDLDLAYDELYCLSPMRGFDIKNAENWSHPAQSNKLPYVAVEPNVFRVARAQGMRCVVWSAYIGKGSCSNPISEVTEERVIGLPQPCKFDDK